jgi:acetyl esterase
MSSKAAAAAARRGRAELRSAGVPVTTVRYNGTIHDFMLLDALSETRATRAAIDQATAFLRAGLGTT